MGNVIIIAVLILIIGIAVYSTIRRVRYGSSCCGERDPGEKKVKVTDKNKNHYPHTYILQVDGMHCSNCARRVENALNAGDGRWAVADVGKREVILRSKHAETESDIGEIIAKAGYTLLGLATESGPRGRGCRVIWRMNQICRKKHQTSRKQSCRSDTAVKRSSNR